MGDAIVVYVVGVVIFVLIELMARTGDEYSDTPVSGCIVCALLWPLFVVVFIYFWLEDMLA